MEAVITTLIWGALIQGLFLAGLYLFSKKHRSLANKLLGFFLLVIVYEGILAFMPFNFLFGFPIWYFTFPVVKLFYPVLFLHYILEKVGRSSRYRNFLRFHYGLAFLIAGITLVNIFLMVGSGQQIHDVLGIELTDKIYMAEQYYAFLLIIVIFIISILEVLRYKEVVRKNYSDIGMLNINWLWRLILIIFPIIVVWGIDLVSILLGTKDSFSIELITWAFVVIFLYFISFQAFRHKNLFEGIPDGEEANKDTQVFQKIKGNAVSDPSDASPEQQEQIERIRRHMENEEPFLDASLSIYQLARQLDMQVRDLSLLINHTLNQHFFDFVNEYRIKKAMEILRDPENRKMTVLETMYEVGFNSKSSFNTVFKKYTGKTPTQYRKAAMAVEQQVK